MPQCPNCETALQTQRAAGRIFFFCPGCEGRAVTFPQLRQVGGDRLINGLLHQMTDSQQRGLKPCPFCNLPMKQIHPDEVPLELDGCKRCKIVWFDTLEFEQIPESPPLSPEEMRLQGTEVMAVEKLRQFNERETDPEPDAVWKAIPASLGLPVETDSDGLARWPWLTWSLALLITAVSVTAFFHLDAAVQQFGFLPTQAWRYGGLTLLTAFFLHGGVWHLSSNLYFLLVFGDNVEDYLGRLRFALLIALATVSGGIFHLLGEPHGEVPAVGASGGISGILVFYALAFPRARLGVFVRYYWRFRWVSFPAWVGFALWMLLQLWTAFEQIAGFGNVSALAHLGGVAIGVLFWLFCHRK